MRWGEGKEPKLSLKDRHYRLACFTSKTSASRQKVFNGFFLHFLRVHGERKGTKRKLGNITDGSVDSSSFYKTYDEKNFRKVRKNFGKLMFLVTKKTFRTCGS